MAEKTSEKELDALKAAIASLREEIAALAAGVKKFAEPKAAKSDAEGDYERNAQESSANSGPGPDAWTDFQGWIDEAWTKNEKLIKGIADEIERRPLAGIIAAFGLGFIIAKLWYGGRKP